MAFVKRVLYGALGIFLLGFTTGVCVKTGIGSGSMGVFLDGLSKTIGISVGTAGWILNLILITGLFFVDKKRIGIFTLLCMLCSKIPTDLAVKYFIGSNSLMINILIVVFATFFMSMGSAFVMKSKLGNGAYDGLAVALSRKLNIRYAYVGYAMQFTMLISGYFLGGVVGIGTIFCVFCYAPMLEFSMNLLKIYD